MLGWGGEVQRKPKTKSGWNVNQLIGLVKENATKFKAEILWLQNSKEAKGKPTDSMADREGTDRSPFGVHTALLLLIYDYKLIPITKF